MDFYPFIHPVNKLVDKSTFLNNNKLGKSDIAIICILGMVAGFLYPRVLLSISMFLFGVTALWGVHPRHWLKDKWWLTGVLWVALYAITWFWSEDKHNWGTRLEVKLPFLLLPLAFPFLPQFTTRQIRILATGIGIMLLAGAGYSIFFLIRDYDFYIKEYSVSHMLPTPARYDYIRFSMTIVLFIIWCLGNWSTFETRRAKWLVGSCITILAVYMHILAAKSGLVSLYLFIFLWGLYETIAKRKLAGLLVLIAIPVVFNIALKFIPTLYERKEQLMASIWMIRVKDKGGNYADQSRLISYDISKNIILQHPMTGVGTGDMLAEMKKGYAQWYPQVEERNMLVPHNQFLTVALGCGIPAMLVFVLWIFWPLAWLRKNRESFFFFSVWLILLVQLMIEPALEVQYGVFVFIFFLLLFRHMLPAGRRQA